MPALSEFSPQPVFRQDVKLWEKWDRAGNALRHRGTTFVSHVVPDSAVHLLGQQIVSDVKANGLQADYGFLPPSSYHMTVLEGFKDYTLTGQAHIWPDWLDRERDFSVNVQKIQHRVENAGVSAPAVLDMRVAGVYHPSESLTIQLEPANSRTREELTRFRQSMSEKLDLPCWDDYRFHISLGYRLTESQGTACLLDELHEKYSKWAKQIKAVELEPVALNVFNDMLSFPPLVIID